MIETIQKVIDKYSRKQKKTIKHLTEWNMLYDFINELENIKQKLTKYTDEGIKYGEKIMIKRLKEEITPRDNMVNYLRGEKIVRPQYQKKYKTKGEVKAYNDGLATAISMIGSSRARIK